MQYFTRFFIITFFLFLIVNCSSENVKDKDIENNDPTGNSNSEITSNNAIAENGNTNPSDNSISNGNSNNYSNSNVNGNSNNYSNSNVNGNTNPSDHSNSSNNYSNGSNNYPNNSDNYSGGENNASDSDRNESSNSGFGNDVGANGEYSNNSEAPVDPDDPQSWQTENSDLEFASVSVGDGNKLELVKMQVTTLVEGFRVRTLVDHIYYNPFDRTLEGTFKYPLPSESNVSYYAMFVGTQEQEPEFFGPDDEFNDIESDERAEKKPEDFIENVDEEVWGELRAARVVRSDDARRVFEDITRTNIDPGLLEEVAPNTFEGRVFPIPAKGYNRVLIAYEQTLPRIGNKLEYKFKLPEGDFSSVDFVLAADKHYIASAQFIGDAEAPVEIDRANAITFSKKFNEYSPGGTMKFQFDQIKQHNQVDLICGTNSIRDENNCYARVYPNIEMVPSSSNEVSQAIFMFDTSLSEHPDRFNIDVELLKAILENSTVIEKFNVITFDASARWLESNWIDNTIEGRQETLAKLNQILLEGSTDFSSALKKLASPDFEITENSNADIFVFSDGVINWGNSSIEFIMQQFYSQSNFNTRFFVYRTGIGAENLELYNALTRKGAIFNCLTAESVANCSTAHEYSGMIIEEVSVVGTGDDQAEISDMLIAGRQATLFPGSQLTVALKLLQEGSAKLKISGTINSVPHEIEILLSLIPAGTLAPRAWAEIAVAQLLQTNNAELEDLAVAMSQHYKIASRLTSFLVLETDEEYELYNLDDESEKFEGQSIVELIDAAIQELADILTNWDRLYKILVDNDWINNILTIDSNDYLGSVINLGPSEELQLTDSSIEIPHVYKSEVNQNYLNNMSHIPSETAVFRDEAEKRFLNGKKGEALRALSSIVENNPSNPESSRLVGYRLNSWNMTNEAAFLFLDVLERRPFEPQSYRDLANTLWIQNPALSSMLFESVIAGDWNQRFGMFKTVVKEEYAMMIRSLSRENSLHPLNSYFENRYEALQLAAPNVDLRVTITWNTDNTDIDLWVTDPEGNKCFYGNTHIPSGGVLLDDLTQGYGPERFESPETIPGKYKVEVHYYGNNGNRLSAETHVNAIIMKHAGSDQEEIERINVVLETVDSVKLIKEVQF